MNVFISGGCKNGKSMFAQNFSKEISRRNNTELYYLATMKPTDDEDLARIARHIEERRDWGFITLEQSEKICGCLNLTNLDQGENQGGAVVEIKEPGLANPKGAFLLDSVTALLSNEMFRADKTVDFDAPERVADELSQFAKFTGNTVFVSDYIYGDAEIYDEITEAYRCGLAYIDKTLAKICQRVIEVSYGNVIEYKEF